MVIINLTHTACRILEHDGKRWLGKFVKSHTISGENGNTILPVHDVAFGRSLKCDVLKKKSNTK